MNSYRTCTRCEQPVHRGACKGVDLSHLHTPEILEKAHEAYRRTLRARADARRRAVRNRLRYLELPPSPSFLDSMRRSQAARGRTA